MSVYDPTGRKALVTGGARGPGEGTARAQAGVAVVIADIREFRPGHEPRSDQVELREPAAMWLSDYLDKGASTHPAGAPCLTMVG